jgi:hypothetical protein
LRPAFIAALTTFITVFLIAGSRAVINGSLDRKWVFDWRIALILSAAFSIAVFLVTFAENYFSQRVSAPAQEILSRKPLLSKPTKTSTSGFVAMEYYALILNRTYVVFVIPEGLYGWKAQGIVSAASPRFYEPYQEMLTDPELLGDRGAIEDLSRLKGGFFTPRAQIATVEATDKSKWGMGGIPHSGRILLGLTDGTKREFILLGSVSPEAIRDSILTASSG